MDKVPILIVGGGIGGLTAALALSRRNCRVHVVEKSSEFGEIGAGLQLAPNAMRVLDELGVLPEIRKHAVYPSRLVWMDAVRGTRITASTWTTPSGRAIDIPTSSCIAAICSTVCSRPAGKRS